MSPPTQLEPVSKENDVRGPSETPATLTIPSKDPQWKHISKEHGVRDAVFKCQFKLFLPLFPHAERILGDVLIPPTLTDRTRIRAYIRSTSITPKSEAYLPQCSEILPGRLWIADHFSGTDPSTIQRLKITHVVCIGPEGYHDGCPRLKGVTHYCIEIAVDLYSMSLVGLIDDTVTCIDQVLTADAEHRFLVHCIMGMDWSPSIAVACLMNDTGCDFREALDTVRTKREVANLDPLLECAVQQWWAVESQRPEFPMGRGYRPFRWAVEESDDETEVT